MTFYKTKAAHVKRSIGHVPLSSLRASHVDDFISLRRKETASENTISKELVALRAALKIMARRGLYNGNISAVMPIAFAPEYKPRKRFLTELEFNALVSHLLPDQAARVAFIVATSASWQESESARRNDVDLESERVLLRGTKRATRYRQVPIVSDIGATIIRYALHHCEGKDGRMFQSWNNVRRDLRIACEKAEIDPCSPNDLRRTFAQWHRAAGVAPDLIAPMMGHADTRMVERVYGRVSVEVIYERVADIFCSTGVRKTPKKTQYANELGKSKMGNGKRNQQEVVPGDGIEPPTRGFSVLCHLIPAPRKHRKNGYHNRRTVMPVQDEKAGTA